jgi:methanogenic corrinoid protein MtbC1
MTEREASIQELTNALLAGKGEEAKQRAYAALARGINEREILDAVVDAANAISDLQELGEYDQGKIASMEFAVNSSLQTLEEWLTKSEGKFGVKTTVGPVGLKAGALQSLVLTASLRSLGFHSVSLGKTQTALDLLRNSEHLDADLVIPILSENGEDHLRNFVEAYERGGFRSKFEVIPIAPGVEESLSTGLMVARNTGEAISKATQWALKRNALR